jgi:folate-binding protein YgfZ
MGPSERYQPPHDVHRDVVTVAGADATTYLQSQLSQDIDVLPTGESRWTFLLGPAGKIDALARIERVDDETYRLDIDAGYGDLLVARLERFKIRVRADVTLHAWSGPPPDDALERARVEAGWPRMGAEIVPGETIPAETGMTPLAVSFTKGCYPGQELVERMDSRGATAPRSLRRLTVAPGAAPGDPISDAEGSAVGTLTSVAGTVALGYVKRGADVGVVVTHQ